MTPMRKPSPGARTLLWALLDQPAAWRHGYDLTKQTGVGAGTLYPLLDRWAAQGLLESEWRAPESPGRPQRHAYRLTPDGVVFAWQWAEPPATPISFIPSEA